MTTPKSVTWQMVVITHNPCLDLDEDCAGVRNKSVCAMHDPSRGYCPFMVKAPPPEKEL